MSLGRFARPLEGIGTLLLDVSYVVTYATNSMVARVIECPADLARSKAIRLGITFVSSQRPQHRPCLKAQKAVPDRLSALIPAKAGEAHSRLWGASSPRPGPKPTPAPPEARRGAVSDEGTPVAASGTRRRGP
jgi:hypothetical protein